MVREVLFVCVHNAARSQMAEAFFNALSSGFALGISAGTEPASEVNPVAVEAMREVGIDIGSRKPRRLTQEMLDRAERIITMGCGVEGVCPATFVEVEDWGLDDPKGQPIEQVRLIRDQIRAKVVKLIRELQAQAAWPPHP